MICLLVRADIDWHGLAIEPHRCHIDRQQPIHDTCPGERLLDDVQIISLPLQMREGSEPAAISMKLAIHSDDLDETDRGCDAFWLHVIAPG